MVFVFVMTIIIVLILFFSLLLGCRGRSSCGLGGGGNRRQPRRHSCNAVSDQDDYSQSMGNLKKGRVEDSATTSVQHEGIGI